MFNLLQRDFEKRLNDELAPTGFLSRVKTVKYADEVKKLAKQMPLISMNWAGVGQIEWNLSRESVIQVQFTNSIELLVYAYGPCQESADEELQRILFEKLPDQPLDKGLLPLLANIARGGFPDSQGNRWAVNPGVNARPATILNQKSFCAAASITPQFRSCVEMRIGHYGS